MATFSQERLWLRPFRKLKGAVNTLLFGIFIFILAQRPLGETLL